MQEIYLETGDRSNYKSKLEQVESFNQNVNQLKQYGKQIQQIGQGCRQTSKRFAQPFSFKTNSIILSFLCFGVLGLLYAALTGTQQTTLDTVILIFLLAVLNIVFFASISINLGFRKQL